MKFPKAVKWRFLGRMKTIKRVKVLYCQCECGKKAWVYKSNIMSLKSTACLGHARIKTGDSMRPKTHPLYILNRRWISIRQRCRNKNNVGYKDYGGRGISLCDEWEKYEAFREWALKNGYEKHLTIERVDVNKGYSPSNCKWVPLSEQSSNTRRTKFIEGEVINHVAKKLNVSRSAVVRRVNAGWSLSEIKENPKRKKLYDLPKYVTKRPNGKYRVRMGRSGSISLGDFDSLKEAIMAIKRSKQ